ncbi:hypothetical protein [Allomuricauda sp. d1]|uniref:hypothetical protein n=1 Tax=Allomuricauda sp. d1 TaxID=3136725 RepID=UPI0031CEBD7A
MKTLVKKQSYLERRRTAILNFGYDYVAFRNRAKKSLVRLKELIRNESKTF